MPCYCPFVFVLLLCFEMLTCTEKGLLSFIVPVNALGDSTELDFWPTFIARKMKCVIHQAISGNLTFLLTTTLLHESLN